MNAFKRTTKKVLLLDDDHDFVAQNRTVLEQAGFEVWEATNREDGLRVARAELPDLIVLDVMLPQAADGFTVSRELRNFELTRGIPQIAVTAVNEVSPYRVEPDETWLPVNALVEKPVSPQALMALIQETFVAAGTEERIL